MLEIMAVADDLVVSDTGWSPPLSEVTARSVDAAWSTARLAVDTDAFDAPVFCVAELGEDRITGGFCSYRLLSARLVHVAREMDAMRFLAVTGITTTLDGRVLVARRSDRVAQHAGRWSFVPSGGVSRSGSGGTGPVDLRSQLATELAEELGIAGTVGAPLCLVVDDEDGVIDVVLPIALDDRADEAVRAAVPTDEFDELIALSPDELRRLLDDDVEPVTRALLCSEHVARAVAGD